MGGRMFRTPRLCPPARALSSRIVGELQDDSVIANPPPTQQTHGPIAGGPPAGIPTTTPHPESSPHEETLNRPAHGQRALPRPREPLRSNRTESEERKEGGWPAIDVIVADGAQVH